ncbi:HPr family phosphocarrier protein [Streptomyces sp. N2-109]|uniref:HPr family phosphocarrier protein n=1 Tax=Streptomyces gossypii TaxID=2883101 RepID=A0ABT2JMG6_9ACTN|nr:HPr family phosphocarrier protein [Streptomyces gossypii]MCT2589072.1 HPr family phosphocarrier protein [Streptomyces gossypii]
MSPSSDIPAGADAAAPAQVPGPREETTVVLPAHLHARPAGQLAQAAGRFTSTLELVYGDRTVNPRGVLGLMSLGATSGTSVVVRAEGPDAAEAVTALAEVLHAAE